MDNSQFLILGGIFGEALKLPIVGNYLKETADILKGFGVKDTNCYTLSSNRCALENSKLVTSLILKHSRECDKPITIMAHSKGCLEVALSYRKRPELFRKLVKKVILVQPPFQGSAFIRQKSTAKLLLPFKGIHSLSKGNYINELNSVFGNINDEYIRTNVLVVKSVQTNKGDVSWILKLPYSLYRMNNEFSDGLLRYKDQTLEKEMYKVVNINMDHSDLFCSSRLSNMKISRKNEIFKNLLEWVDGRDISSNHQMFVDINGLKNHIKSLGHAT